MVGQAVGLVIIRLQVAQVILLRQALVRAMMVVLLHLTVEQRLGVLRVAVEQGQ